MGRILKEIQWHKSMSYQKRSFRGTSTNGKFTGVNIVDAKMTILEKN